MSLIRSYKYQHHLYGWGFLLLSWNCCCLFEVVSGDIWSKVVRLWLKALRLPLLLRSRWSNQMTSLSSLFWRFYVSYPRNHQHTCGSGRKSNFKADQGGRRKKQICEWTNASISLTRQNRNGKHVNHVSDEGKFNCSNAEWFVKKFIIRKVNPPLKSTKKSNRWKN